MPHAPRPPSRDSSSEHPSNSVAIVCRERFAAPRPVKPRAMASAGPPLCGRCRRRGGETYALPAKFAAVRGASLMNYTATGSWASTGSSASSTTASAMSASPAPRRRSRSRRWGRCCASTCRTSATSRRPTSAPGRPTSSTVSACCRRTTSRSCGTSVPPRATTSSTTRGWERNGRGRASRRCAARCHRRQGGPRTSPQKIRVELESAGCSMSRSASMPSSRRSCSRSSERASMSSMASS